MINPPKNSNLRGSASPIRDALTGKVTARRRSIVDDLQAFKGRLSGNQKQRSVGLTDRIPNRKLKLVKASFKKHYAVHQFTHER